MRYLIIFSILAMGAHCGPKVLRQESGSMKSKKSGSFVIIIPAGKKIAIKIDQLRLRRRGLVTIKNQQTGRRIQFKMEESTLYKINGTEKTAVEFPATVELEATKLRIWVKKSRTFLARYTVFVDGENTCRKNRLAEDVTVTSCDSGDVSPVAELCDVTVTCPQNFKQDRNSMSCYQGIWYGKPRCLPDEVVINERCQTDSEASRVPTSCPYSAEELARYLAFHNLPFDTLQSDRSSGRTIDCRSTCRRAGNGAWLVNCSSPPSRSVYVKCWVCRVYAKCRKQNVVFA